MEKEVRIQVPEGMEIDKENSTFECIKFKPIQKKRWRDDDSKKVEGYFITNSSIISQFIGYNKIGDYNLFATEKQAKSALAMARISQIMANDARFGGVVTDEEWKNGSKAWKYVIYREKNRIAIDTSYSFYRLLAFHTAEQRDLFLKENEDLVRDYLMID